MDNQTSIKYKGEVTLKYKMGDKVIKVKKCNRGWSQLFRLIALLLTGNLTTEQLDIMKPTFIDIKYRPSGSTSDNSWNSCLYSRVPVVPTFYVENDSTVEGGNVNYISCFTCTISYANLNQSLLDENSETNIFLLSGESYTTNDISTRLAALIVDTDSLLSMEPGSQVVVEWTMRFYNAIS